MTQRQQRQHMCCCQTAATATATAATSATSEPMTSPDVRLGSASPPLRQEMVSFFSSVQYARLISFGNQVAMSPGRKCCTYTHLGIVGNIELG